jgi:hypothetical protein
VEAVDELETQGDQQRYSGSKAWGWPSIYRSVI